MMKTGFSMKKVRIGLLGLTVFVLAFFFYANLSLKVSATTPTTDSNLVIEGASVRTVGNPGIRFEGNQTGFVVPAGKTVVGYGIVLAYGQASANASLVVGGTVNTKNVTNKDVDEVDENGKFYITVINIPSSAYAQYMTARAYVKLSDDSYIYGTSVSVRNLAQVVVNEHNKPGYVEEDNLIKTVYDLVEEKEVDDSQIESINSLNPDLVVNSAATKSIVLLKEKNDATESLNKIYTFKAYTTIASAISAAKPNYNVFAFNGTYSDALNLNVEGLTLVGNNYGVNGHDSRNSETLVSNNVTISANNVTIDGLKIGKTLIIGANSAMIDHSYLECEPDTTCNGNNRKALIVDAVDSNIQDLTVQNSKLNVLGEIANYLHEYMAFTIVKNLTVNNNYISNNPTSLDDNGGEGIMIYYNHGTTTFRNNEFHFATKGYLIRSNYYETSDNNRVIFSDNYVTGSNSLHTSTIYFKYLATNSEVEVIGNEFYDMDPTTFMFDYAKTGTNIKIAYNYFDANSLFKGGSYGGRNLIIGGNVFDGGVDVADNFKVNSTNKFNSKNELTSSYNKFKTNVQSQISYELDSGTNSAKNLNTYVEADVVKLYNPTRDGYKFLGWTTVQESSSYINYLPLDSTGDISLFAHWTDTVDVELSANDTRVIRKYSPTKFVNADFTGGKFNIDGTEYTVGAGALFTTIGDAVSASSNGDIIYVFAGTYTFGSRTISKNLTILGPNADIDGNGSRGAEAIAPVSTITINSSLTINGLELSGATTAFQTGTSDSVNPTMLELKYCYIHDYTNVLRYESSASTTDFAAYMNFNKFSVIKQFFIWARNNAHLARFDFIGNTITSDAWGGTAQNSNIRIDNAKSGCQVNVIGNEFQVNPTLNSSTCGFLGINTTNASATVSYNIFTVSNASKFTNYFRPATKNTTITNNVYKVGSSVQNAVPSVTLSDNTSSISGAIDEATRNSSYVTYLETYPRK